MQLRNSFDSDFYNGFIFLDFDQEFDFHANDFFFEEILHFRLHEAVINSNAAIEKGRKKN